MHWHLLRHLAERGRRPIQEPVPLVDFPIAELEDLEVSGSSAQSIWWRWKYSWLAVVEMTSIPRYRRKKSILVGMVAAILADFGGLLQIPADFGGSPSVSGTTAEIRAPSVVHRISSSGTTAGKKVYREDLPGGSQGDPSSVSRIVRARLRR